jgi:hypothetical protein
MTAIGGCRQTKLPPAIPIATTTTIRPAVVRLTASQQKKARTNAKLPIRLVLYVPILSARMPEPRRPITDVAFCIMLIDQLTIWSYCTAMQRYITADSQKIGREGQSRELAVGPNEGQESKKGETKTLHFQRSFAAERLVQVRKDVRRS